MILNILKSTLDETSYLLTSVVHSSWWAEIENMLFSLYSSRNMNRGSLHPKPHDIAWENNLHVALMLPYFLHSDGFSSQRFMCCRCQQVGQNSAEGDENRQQLEQHCWKVHWSVQFREGTVILYETVPRGILHTLTCQFGWRDSEGGVGREEWDSSKSVIGS